MKPGIIFTIVILLFAVAAASAQSSTAAEGSFPPFDQWKAAVLSADATALKSLYSTDPAAQIRIKTVMRESDADTSFWLAL